jgi:hypothetical protein
MWVLNTSGTSYLASNRYEEDGLLGLIRFDGINPSCGGGSFESKYNPVTLSESRGAPDSGESNGGLSRAYGTGWPPLTERQRCPIVAGRPLGARLCYSACSYSKNWSASVAPIVFTRL